jgi:hypothetical protein
MTQSDFASHREYAASKPKATRSFVNKLCQTPWSRFTTLLSQYMAPQSSSASAPRVMELMESAFHKLWPQPPKPTAEEAEALRESFAALKFVAQLAAQQRTAPPRSRYKRPTGSNPTVMVNTQRTEQGDSEGSSFTDMLKSIAVARLAGGRRRRPRSASLTR